jgi:hypothetical protein
MAFLLYFCVCICTYVHRYIDVNHLILRGPGGGGMTSQSMVELNINNQSYYCFILKGEIPRYIVKKVSANVFSVPC